MEFKKFIQITINWWKNKGSNLKFTLDSYHDALKAKDEKTYKLALNNHVKKVQGHINDLAKKKYSNNQTHKGVILDGVIMFIPIEGALAMALAHDENLLEYAFDKKIILTFPTSFLAILQNLSMNIEQASLTRDLQDASNKAGELNNALEAFLKKFNDIGIKIKLTASIYNEAHNKLKTTLKKGEQFAELTAKKTNLSLVEEIPEKEINQFKN